MRYFESFVDSIQMPLADGTMIVFKRGIAVVDDETGEQLIKTHRTAVNEISEDDYNNRRAAQALNDPQDALRAQIRQDILQELAEKQNVGGVGVTGGATPRQEGFRTQDEVNKDAGIVKVAAATTNAIATAQGKQTK